MKRVLPSRMRRCVNMSVLSTTFQFAFVQRNITAPIRSVIDTPPSFVARINAFDLPPAFYEETDTWHVTAGDSDQDR